MTSVAEPREPMTAERDWRTLQTEHASLSESAQRLDERLAALAQGDAGDPAGPPVPDQIARFRVQLFEHLAAEEEGEVLERAATVEPRFQRHVARLRRQHAELRDHMSALLAELESPDWAELRRRFAGFRRLLQDHERAENDVLQRAYLEDVGGQG